MARRSSTLMTMRFICVPARATVALLTAGSLAACIPVLGNRVPSRQQVVRKESENTLVANSGATCRVKDDEFARINVGDVHGCVWRYRDGGGEQPRTGTMGPVQDQAPRRAPGRPGGF